MISYNTPFILPSHDPTYLVPFYVNFFRIQYNFILYKYINIHTYLFIFFIFLLFINFFFYYYFIFFFVFRDMFRDVPECSMFLLLSTAAIARSEIQMRTGNEFLNFNLIKK